MELALLIPVGVVAAAILLYLLGVGFGALDAFMARWAFLVLEAGGAAACIARAVVVRAERGAWSLLAIGMTLWMLGDAYWRIALFELDDPPIPSPADVLWLGFYPFAYAAVAQLIRARARHVRATVWMDGLIAALAVAAVTATIVFDAVLESVGGAPLETATNLTYPLADMLLLAFVFAAFAITGWRFDRTWIWLGAGLAVFAVSDSVYLYRIAQDAYVPGGVLDAGWGAALFLMGIAAWRFGDPVTVAQRAETWRSIVLPICFGLVVIALVTYDHYTRVTALAVILASGCLVAVLGRLVFTFAQNLRMLAKSRIEAMTDPLTGLANRRGLAADLDALLPGSDQWPPWVLAMFDLDGFKLYNDSFGHPAGDALLKRLGGRLADAVGERGRTYRVGGDEFCVLFAPGDAVPECRLSRLGAALSEQGEAFSIDCSYGWVEVPAEAEDADAAMLLVDQRMYAQKHGGRKSARAQSKDVLLQALAEHSPELRPHLGDVAELAGATARQLRIKGPELDHVRAAGELHDIGKVAVPETILAKPGPLDEEEWEYVKRHSAVGERILAAAPALAEVAKLVRSVHERLDGGGYPDGLAGDEIPLGSRVVAVCDAFDAMTSERPYRRAMDQASALAELRRSAGSQFDPEVVQAFSLLRGGHDAREDSVLQAVTARR